MFAYCLNNPINSLDPRGTIPFYDDPLQKAIEDFVQWYNQSDENEENSDGDLTLNAKWKRTAQAFVHNVKFSAGIGLGLFGEIFATEYVSVNAGIHYDLLRVQYYKGEFEIFEYAYQGAEASFLFFNLGDSEERRREISSKPNQWQIIESPSVFPEASISFYLFAGGSVSIGIDLLSIAQSIIETWWD